jgi:N-acyl-D-amino-acid deacylase
VTKAALPRAGVVRVVMTLLIVSAAIAACSTAPEFDLVVRGGTVYDGTGQAVGVKGDRITGLGDLSGRGAGETIDATGKAVAPGFIDAHGQSGISLLADGYGESHLRQGITSEIIADRSPAFWTANTADLALAGRYSVAFDWMGPAGYFAKLESRGTAINVGTLVPASLARAPGAASSFVDDAMRAGALGVVDDASGGDVAVVSIDDLGAMAATAGRYNGVFMAPLSDVMPAADSAAAIVAEGAHARAIVITELMNMTPAEAATGSSVVQVLAAATQRNVVVYGASAPYAHAADGSDAGIRQAFRQWGLTIGTDSTAMVRGVQGVQGVQQVRAAFGAFPRLLGQWARDDQVLMLASAIRQITSVPASIFDMPMRGIIRENYFADLVVFDPATVSDRSTDQKPDEYPAGISHVIVNGVVTLSPNGLSGARAGRRLIGFGARRRPS